MLLWILLVTLLAAAPGDPAVVRAARTAQNQAIAAGDLERVASFWTEDVTVRRALGQPLNGREAARKALEPPAPPASRLIYQRLTKDVEVSPKWPLASGSAGVVIASLPRSRDCFALHSLGYREHNRVGTGLQTCPSRCSVWRNHGRDSSSAR